VIEKSCLKIRLLITEGFSWLFLKFSNGGERELPVDPYWFQILPADEVLKHNEGYQQLPTDARNSHG